MAPEASLLTLHLTFCITQPWNLNREKTLKTQRKIDCFPLTAYSPVFDEMANERNKKQGNKETNKKFSCFLVMAVCIAPGLYPLKELKNTEKKKLIPQIHNLYIYEKILP